MEIEVKVPTLGESETEATLVSCLKKVGDHIEVDDIIAEIESDKITMEVTAAESGILKAWHFYANDTVTPGEILAIIETDQNRRSIMQTVKKALPIKKREVAVQEEASLPQDEPIDRQENSAPTERVRMSRLRQNIAQRLKDAQHTAAILTTFNEVNMQGVMELRSKYREQFKDHHGVDLGLMSFFVKACVEALKHHPIINASIEGQDIVYHHYNDIGIAVASKKGLVVPVLRHAQNMGFSDIERGIQAFSEKAKTNHLMPDDLKGGTFSISNGGIFGSLMSTPILNPPQSAILGMHNIQKRVIVENDEMVIRPMMYLALSYDHRLIDGKDAVQFLSEVKEMIEYPAKMILDI
ncbi:MAG: dihydrolipoyllysine-residue succinyltransferase [Mariprofundaceae bacterium]|nr:dihydrolipoyllysine-residue succinyltransferase [Mariprofundaceae bacterium]